MQHLHNILRGTLSSALIATVSLTSAAAFAQAGHYLSVHPSDNEHITAFDHWIEDP
jgi:hypothetical protein